jgi:hypothetical protein
MNEFMSEPVGGRVIMHKLKSTDGHYRFSL